MKRDIRNIYNILHNREKLQEIYDECQTMAGVAKKLGCGETIIHTWIHKLGIKPKPRIATLKGHKRSESCKKKLSEWAKQRIGNKNSNWRNGACKLGILIRGRKWRERRRLVLERDNYECVECGNDLDLHVHHIKPVNQFPEFVNDLDNLKTLCVTCHRKIHFPKANFANSVKPQPFRVGNAELSGVNPNRFFRGSASKCVETIYETVRDN